MFEFVISKPLPVICGPNVDVKEIILSSIYAHQINAIYEIASTQIDSNNMPKSEEEFQAEYQIMKIHHNPYFNFEPRLQIGQTISATSEMVYEEWDCNKQYGHLDKDENFLHFKYDSQEEFINSYSESDIAQNADILFEIYYQHRIIGLPEDQI